MDFDENGSRILLLEDMHDAAFKGKIEKVQYLHKEGCTWDERTCYLAASRGHLECVRYAHENGYGENRWIMIAKNRVSFGRFISFIDAVAHGGIACAIMRNKEGI